MTTDTQTMVSDNNTDNTDNTEQAITTSKTSSKVKKAGGGRPAGYSPQLPFTTGKLVKGLAENAFKEFVKLNELCESGKASTDDLTTLLKKQAVAGLEVRKAASLVWLTQGMLLHTLKDKVKAEGGSWMPFFDDNLAAPLNLSPRSEQLQRKMFTDWQAATAALPEQTARALEECEQVNDLAGKLKKLSSGRDPWENAPPEETPTLVDETAKRRQKWMRQLEAMAVAMVKDEVPSFITDAVNAALDGLQTTTINAGVIESYETVDIDVEPPPNVDVDQYVDSDGFNERVKASLKAKTPVIDLSVGDPLEDAIAAELEANAG